MEQEVSARDKAYIGATAMFDAPQKHDLTRRERQKICEVMAILKNLADDEMAQVLMGCVLMLGDRIVDGRIKHASRAR
jgi:hypothetical protein